MKAELINPFLSAAMKVIETMAFLKPQPGKPYLKKDHLAKGDITGIIGVAGNMRGSVAVSFSADCALQIISNMLGEEIEELNNDARDAVGELTNMIAGDARRELSRLGYTLEAGIPTVIVGKNHIVEHISTSPIIVIPFTTEKGSFVVEASFED